MTMTVTDPVERYVAGRDWRMLIGGEFVEASGHQVTDTYDPSTGRVLAAVPDASAADVARAVAAAAAAQPAWQRIGHAGRAACFAEFGALVETHLEELAMLDAIDCGNPVAAMRVDAQISLQYIAGWPGLAQAMTGRVIPASADGLHFTSSRPYGVVGRITAFNHPLMFAATRPLPALITGNSIVIKPSPQTPLATLRLAELFAQAFPPGVVNVVTGGADSGDALVTDARVKRIAFTGSLQVGLLIQRRAAESGHVKHVSLELGGKNAMVVFPDVDIPAAVDGAVDGMNFTVCQGQSCGSNSRILVHAAIHDEFVAALADRLRSLRVGRRTTTAPTWAPWSARRTTSGCPASSTARSPREPSWSPAPTGRRMPIVGLLPQPRGAGRRAPRHGGGDGRDLRTGGERAAVGRLRPDARRRQRRRPRPHRERLDPRSRPRAPHGPGTRRGVRVGQRLQPALLRYAVRRHQGQRHGARGVGRGARQLRRAEGGPRPDAVRRGGRSPAGVDRGQPRR
jgi:hypothetical protein